MEGTDFGTIVAGIAAAGIVAAILSTGVIKIAPNFTKWGVNKLVGLFR
jgi:hypothetical protein